MALITDSALEHLARQPLPPITLSDEGAEQVAHLALLIAQTQARILPPHVAIPYRERTQNQRDAMRMGVYRVVQALILLGYIDAPQ